MSNGGRKTKRTLVPLSPSGTYCRSLLVMNPTMSLKTDTACEVSSTVQNSFTGSSSIPRSRLVCITAGSLKVVMLQPPGTTWTYLSCHLQFAGAMAVAASGLPIQELFSKYLYSPFNMTKTSWGPAKNPSMAGGITTTGTDFENMLHRLLTYKVLPKFILDQMETDYSKVSLISSNVLRDDHI